MGGFDIFYSSLYDNGEWSAPLNMGYPINTPDDDKFYVPVGEGFFAYYSLFAESGYGNMDVFQLEIFSNEHPRKFRVSGVVNLSQTPVGFKEQIQALENVRLKRFRHRDRLHPRPRSPARAVQGHQATVPSLGWPIPPTDPHRHRQGAGLGLAATRFPT